LNLERSPKSNVQRLPCVTLQTLYNPMHHFCTYFDSNYLIRFLPMVRSLRNQFREPFRLFALCLDDAAERALDALGLEGVEPVPLRALEEHDAALTQVKANRSRIEYYFTCTPAWVRYLFDRCADADLMTYLDADLFFYASPQAIFDEMGDASVAIIPHRVVPRAQYLDKYGLYNVGMVVIRRDSNGQACLQWWRERCLEWCYDRVEGNRFADQKYLDQWTALFQGVHVVQHKGANVAPGNVERYRVSRCGGKVFVDEEPLVFYHFEVYKQETPHLVDTGLVFDKQRLPPEVIRLIHLPYVRETLRCRRMLERTCPEMDVWKGNTRLDREAPRTCVSAFYTLRCALEGRFILCFAGRGWYGHSELSRTLLKVYDRLRKRLLRIRKTTDDRL
jgi:hypothetical protein